MTDVANAVPDDLRHLLREEDRPAWCPPMKATLHDEAFSDPAWVFEPKLDGVRALAIRDGDHVELVSRNERTMNATYPELVGALATAGPGRFTVDGEIVAFDGERTSFERLQARMNVQDPARAVATGVAVYLYVFDVIHLDGYDTTALPLVVRKELLEAAFDLRDPLRFSRHSPEHGRELFAEACRRGWEGLIAKRADSPYRVGARSRDWLKLKCLSRQEFVIGGFTDPQGSRTGFGALLLGYHEDGRLRYAGKVGTGYDEATLRRLRAVLDDLELVDAPFADPVRERGAHWVQPRLVCEVAFAEWTQDGKLRHPRFLGLRDDKDPHDVVREAPA